MEYRRLGKSEIDVSVIAFGAWAIGGWLWGGADEADAIKAIEAAIDAGVTTIDTAPVYGFGRSEEIVAKAVAGKRDKVQLLTKYGLLWDSDRGQVRWQTTDLQGRPVTIRRNSARRSVIEECERSLKRLGTDHIDLYQCHWPDSDTPVEETMSAIAELIEAGKVRASGVSNFNIDEMAATHAVVPLASSQPPYSMVNRGIEADVLPWCIDHDIAVIPYSPLQRGLLTGKFKPNHKFAKGDHRADNAFFRPANIRKINALLDELRPIAAAHDATLTQLAICWTIHQPGITAALVGARNPAQVAENVRAAELKLSDEEMQRINDLLDALELDI